MFTVSISRWFESRTAKKVEAPPSGGDRLKDSVAFYERKPFRIRKLAGQNTTMQFGFPMCQMFLLVVPYFDLPFRAGGYKGNCSLRLRKGQTEISMDTAGTSAAAISAPTGTSAATGADATGAATGATAGDDPPTAPAIPSSMAS